MPSSDIGDPAIRDVDRGALRRGATGVPRIGLRILSS